MINYKIENEFINITTDKMNVILCTIGASIYRLKAFNHDFLLSCDDRKEFLYSKGYYGKTLGPIAGRYNLKDYENGIDEDVVILHGEENGLSFKKFDYKINKNDKRIKVTFTHKLDIKNKDFNGNHVLYKVIYIINNDKEQLLIKHEIKAYKDTYASLSTHSYFVLNDANKCLDYKMKLNAESRSIVKDNFLIESVAPIDDGFNFKTLKIVKHEIKKNPKLLAKGHYFYNKDKDIIIKDDKYKIIIKSDYKDVLLTLDQLPVGTIFNNKKEDKFDAIVIENEIAPNQKEELFIKAKQTRKHYIKYIFKEFN